MAVPQRARSWLAISVFSATLALSSPWTIHSAVARNIKRTPSTDLTPSLAEQPARPPQTVVAAVLDAGRSTGIDPALLLTIAATESRFRTDAKNQTSSAAGLLQFTKQTWLENMKKFGGKYGLSRFADLNSSVRHWPSCCARFRQRQNMGAQERPAHCYIVGCGTFGLPKGTIERSAPASHGLLPHPCLGRRWSQPLYRGGHRSSVSAMQGCCR